MNVYLLRIVGRIYVGTTVTCSRGIHDNLSHWYRLSRFDAMLFIIAIATDARGL